MPLITLLTAEPNKGKTTAALAQLQSAKAVFFVPSPRNNNPALAAVPWVFLKDLDAARLKYLRSKLTHFRVVMEDGDAPRLSEFMTPDWQGWAFLFDDFPQIFINKPAQAQFAHFAAGIRHRDGEIVVTTQRVFGMIPVFVQRTADHIFQVGPLVERREAQALYYIGGSGTYADFKDFYRDISQNPPYHLFAIKNTA